jgi:hypothetical protein
MRMPIPVINFAAITSTLFDHWHKIVASYSDLLFMKAKCLRQLAIAYAIKAALSIKRILSSLLELQSNRQTVIDFRGVSGISNLLLHSRNSLDRIPGRQFSYFKYRV